MNITVLYYVENHRDRFVTILGAFSDDVPGSGKLNAAIDTHMASLAVQGIRGVTREDYRISIGQLDKPETWIF